MASDATQILTAISDAVAAGDGVAAARMTSDELLPLVYADLRALAARSLASERQRTIDATELVHEAWMRLIGPGGPSDAPVDWEGRRHFLGAAAIAMRRILIDRARARKAAKRGGGADRLEFDSRVLGFESTEPDDLLDLDAALGTLEAEYPQHAEVVRLRVFLAMTTADVATILDLSTATVERRWSFARAWLIGHMDPSET